ncbi:alpha/beta fold hydrolase [Micromonospora yasonensis]|uniref:thioesterase II family protein n=1 Tax=Micromonospora yasonensis TaxID=1128667 RepID=UPI0022322CA5|nr:alpha/beta fold hydrolase [Micromonospora yasonensis]MCW3845084.1 alpha/beta fold hydrolase [Micromonospora yasonensis]
MAIPPPPPATAAWLSRAAPRPQARLRLLCLPYAGAGGGAYRAWATWLGPDVELWTGQLPGRERRLAEPPLDSLAGLAAPLVDAITARIRPPFAIFGHSMGGLLGYEVTRRLVERGDPAPQRLVVSAAQPPQHAGRTGRAHTLDDAGLTGWLRDLGGVPDELLADPALLGLILPTVRADLAAVATYRPAEVVALPLPVDVVVATDDPVVGPEAAAGWAACTTAGLTLTVVPGGHLYLHDTPPPLHRLLAGGGRAAHAYAEGATP